MFDWIAMETKIVNITPKLARSMLQRNLQNRPLRMAHVERLRLSFERGEYRMTHQGVAISADGVVIDGQHRLTAIAMMEEGRSFPMLVSTGMDFADAFSVVDSVVVPRSVSDVLQIDRKTAEVGAFLCRIVHGSIHTTPTLVAPYVEFSKEAADELNAACSSSAKTWSAATVRSAGVVCMMRGIDADYVKLMYRSLVLADFAMMTPVITSLFRSHLSGKVRATDKYDLFARCLRAFNPKNSNMAKVQIKDSSADIAGVRSWLQSAMSNRLAA